MFINSSLKGAGTRNNENNNIMEHNTTTTMLTQDKKTFVELIKKTISKVNEAGREKYRYKLKSE